MGTVAKTSTASTGGLVGRDPATGRFSMISLMDERGAVKVDDVAEVFAMSKAQLADTAGLAREVFQKARRRDGPKAQSRVREMLEIINLVQTWAGAQPKPWPGIVQNPSRPSVAGPPRRSSNLETPQRFATMSITWPPADTLEVSGRVFPGA